MDRILVATDFSERSDRALRRATLIAKRVEAALILVHVVDGDRPARLVASDEAAAWSVLEESAKTLRDHDGILAESLVRVDDVDAGVLAAAEETRAQLVVLGPHRSRLRDVFVGTTVERVVRRTRLPMLVAVQTPSAPYGRTLLALDLDDASKSAARAAVELGVFEHTDVIAFHSFATMGKGMMQRAMMPKEDIDEHVDTERALAVRRLRDLVDEVGLPPSGQRVAEHLGTPVGSILETAAREDAQLIVMGTNQRKGFERLLIGSVTEDVIRHTRRDVLIVPIEPD